MDGKAWCPNWQPGFMDEAEGMESGLVLRQEALVERMCMTHTLESTTLALPPVTRTQLLTF